MVSALVGPHVPIRNKTALGRTKPTVTEASRHKFVRIRKLQTVKRRAKPY